MKEYVSAHLTITNTKSKKQDGYQWQLFNVILFSIWVRIFRLSKGHGRIKFLPRRAMHWFILQNFNAVSHIQHSILHKYGHKKGDVGNQ